MAKQNCWEFKNCGRQMGGNKADEMGICPAYSSRESNGLNNGKNGGRICWAVTGTFCGGKAQGTFAQKKLSCVTCEFFMKVKEEEGAGKFLIMKRDKVNSNV